jgi:RHS repeat-associated protein
VSDDMSATIMWGDGPGGTPGTVGSLGNGIYPVRGVHTYAEEGSYQQSVTLTDAGGQTAVASQPVTVADNALVDEQALPPLTGAAGVALANGAVAAFGDADPNGVSGDFTATIDWGDGTRGPGTVVPQGSGFEVTGSHTYAQAGLYVVGVLTDDVGGSNLVTTVDAEIQPPAAPPWSSTAGERRNDQDLGVHVPLGEAEVTPDTGGVRLRQALDFDQSPGTAVGSDPALVYNSDTVSVRPIIETALTGGSVVPTSIQAQLVWNGLAESPVTYNVTNPTAGVTYLLDLQVPAGQELTASGLYPWQVNLRIFLPGGTEVDRTVSGVSQEVVNDHSPYGAGWGLDGVSRLVFDVQGDALLTSGAGDSRLFTRLADGTFRSPPEDFGTLMSCCNSGYTYTTRDQVQYVYDSTGLLRYVLDPHGNTRAYTYSAGLLTAVDTPDHAHTVLSYDGTGLLSNIAESGGRVVQLFHDGQANLTQVLDVDGTRRTLGYDGGHRLTQDLWGPLGAGFGYDGTTGRLALVNQGLGVTTAVLPAALQGFANPVGTAGQAAGVLTNALGAATAYTLDLLGRALAVQTADGGTQLWGRDVHGDPFLSVDPMGRVSYYQYSDQGDELAYLHADGVSLDLWAYDPVFHHVQQHTDPMGRVTAYAYNDAGDPVLMAQLLNFTQVAYTVSAWSADGHLLAVTDPDGATVRYGYDAAGRQTGLLDALGNRTTMTYDAVGNLLTTVDPRGAVTTTVYDGRNRLVGQVNPAGDGTAQNYDAIGDVTETIDGRGFASFNLYDQVGRLTEATDAAGLATVTRYDPANRVTQTIDPAGRATAAAYDVMGRATEAIDGDGRPQFTAYDRDGEVVGRIDPRGVATYSYPDANGRVTETTDGDGRPSYTFYDLDGEAALTVDARGVPTYELYGGGGRLVETVDGNGRAAFQLYDRNGNETATIDAAGRTAFSLYDGDGRVTESINGDGQPSYAYHDGDGEVTETLDAAGHKAFTAFDGDGRATETLDGANHPSYRAYDGDGQVTESLDGAGVASYAYFNPDGQATESMDGAGKATYNAYDGDGNVTAHADADGHNTFSYYDGDGDGNVTESLDASGRLTFALYDGDGRATEAIDGNNRPSYTLYDGDGHVTESLDATGRRTLSFYDGAGNATETVNGDNQPSYALYDGDGQVTESLDGDGHPAYSFRDGDGQVTESLDGAGKASYRYYDGDGQVTEDLDATRRAAYSAYDGDGRVTESIDGNNRPSYTLYDPNGNVTEQADADGHDSFSYYDGDGRATESADNNGKASYSYYDPAGDVTESLDAASRRTFAYYDGDGNVTESADADGHDTFSVYDGDGRATESIDGNNRPSFTFYDGDGNVTEGLDGAGRTTFTAFDGAGRATETIDGNRPPSFTFYDAAGQATETVDATGKAAYSAYDGDGQVTERVDANGRASFSAYDGDGHVTETVDGNGKASFAFYDGDGRATETTDADGNRSYTYYDPNGQLTDTVDADSRGAYEYYDGDGHVTESVDANGKASYTCYDAAGQSTETMDANGKASYPFYDGDGRVTETMDADGYTSFTYYDPIGQVTDSVDADGKASYQYHDGDGHATEAVDGNGKASYTYDDPAGQATETVDANGKPSYNAYDGDGRVTQTVDADGYASYTYYDGDGHVTEALDAANHPTFQSYDGDGNRTALTDADGNTTTFAYDPAGRMTATTDPLGHTSTRAYDPDGRLTATTDRLGRRRAMAYDGDGHLQTETWYAADGTTVVDTLSYSYDADGNPLTASNHNGAYTFTYDSDGRMLSEQEPFGVTLAFGYDAAGNRTSVTDSLGGTTTSVYDGNGQLTSRQLSVAGGTGLRVDLGYDGAGHVTLASRATAVAGTPTAAGATAYSYDADGNLTGLQAHDAAWPPNPLLSYTYTYNPNGWLTSQTLNGTTTSYTYDPTGQLTGAGSTAYSYDATGNRTLTGYQTTSGNQLQTDGTWNYHYDAEGNLSWKINPSTGVIWTYTYDDANRLVSALESWNTDPSQGVVPQGTGPNQFEVDDHYDVFGNRIEVIVTDYQGGGRNADTRFAYDGQNAWADLNGSNQLLTRRVYLDGIDQLVARLSSAGVPAWYLTDRQGTVAALADGGGHLVDQYQYDAFGALLSQTSPSWGDRYTYTGREYDALAALYYYRARFYDMATGRFLSMDPVGFDAGDSDLYRYAHNGPTDATDPSGQWEVAQTKAILRDKYPREYDYFVQGHDGHYMSGALALEEDQAGNTTPAGQPVLWVAVPQDYSDATAAGAIAYLVHQYLTEQYGRADADLALAGPAETRRRAMLAAQLLLQGPPTATYTGPSARPVTPADREAQRRYDAELEKARKQLESDEAYYAAMQRSVLQGDPTHYADWDMLERVRLRQVAEEAKRRASLSPGEQLVEFALEQLIWGLATGALGELAGAVKIGRLASSADAFALVDRNPQAVEKALVEGLQESRGGQALSSAELLQLDKAWQEWLPRVKQDLKVLSNTTCFVAGTPLLTPGGSKPVELFAVGDPILSRPEGEPEGAVEVKRVEAVFVRVAPVLRVRVSGRVLGTTREHPVYVIGQGWRCVGQLCPGDVLGSHNGVLGTVEEVTETADLAAVYNLRVADYHTYFVGSEEWGFSVWAHNAEYEVVHTGNGWYKIRNTTTGEFVKGTMEGGKFVAGGNKPLVLRGKNGLQPSLQQLATDWNAGSAPKGGSWEPPNVTTNRHGQLTNGKYTLDSAGMAPHTTGSLKAGKSQFLAGVNEKQLVLDAAAMADKAGLWVGNKAKVVFDQPIGVHAGTGELTNTINVYRTDTGFVHGAPGSP